MPLIKQQSGIPRRDTVLQEAEKTGPTLNRPALKHVMFLRKYEDKHFFGGGYNILTEGAFVTGQSSNAGISLLGIVWVRQIVIS
jgi:hypothetical protein